MRRYETIYISDPELSDDERGSLTERFTELISSQEGTLLRVDDWGQRRMAYEIKKKQRGHYIRLDYCGTGSLVDEMERQFRIDDKILKYMTVLLEKAIDVEAAKDEIAKEEAEKERILKEKAEEVQAASEAAAEKAEAPPAPAQAVSSEKQPNTDADSSDAPETSPESEDASAPAENSSEKEQ